MERISKEKEWKNKQNSLLENQNIHIEELDGTKENICNEACNCPWTISDQMSQLAALRFARPFDVPHLIE